MIALATGGPFGSAGAGGVRTYYIGCTVVAGVAFLLGLLQLIFAVGYESD
ncbi:hypothetical protein ACFL01_04690 [Planctomycetota bacterium]